jgi:hypothetical protein
VPNNIDVALSFINERSYDTGCADWGNYRDSLARALVDYGNKVIFEKDSINRFHVEAVAEDLRKWSDLNDSSLKQPAFEALGVIIHRINDLLKQQERLCPLLHALGAPLRITWDPPGAFLIYNKGVLMDFPDNLDSPLNNFQESFFRKKKEKERIVDRRRFTLEDAMKGKFIPMYEGCPNREAAIGKDDILNLEIALHTCNNVESFLEAV